MFIYSIPTSNEEIVFSTPLNAKSLRGYFFEYKDVSFGNVFSQKIDYINVAGRNICKNLPIYPFTTAYGMSIAGGLLVINRYNYCRVFIPADINVDNSEVTVKGLKDNQLNICFIFDENEVKKERFLFFEHRALNNNDNFQNAHFYTNQPAKIFFMSAIVRYMSMIYSQILLSSYRDVDLQLTSEQNQWFEQRINAGLFTPTQNNTWKDVFVKNDFDIMGKEVILEQNKNIAGTGQDIIVYNYFFGYFTI
ncbi:MAG: hypothetical protein LBS50_11005 [Prevotellaceae bacterium]|jgi:hypothetical protein|nr:hypothetical protein [Prevotellaceae bacterium]